MISNLIKQIAADTSKLGSRHPKTVNAALLGASSAHLVVRC